MRAQARAEEQQFPGGARTCLQRQASLKRGERRGVNVWNYTPLTGLQESAPSRPQKV